MLDLVKCGVVEARTEAGAKIDLATEYEKLSKENKLATAKVGLSYMNICSIFGTASLAERDAYKNFLQVIGMYSDDKTENRRYQQEASKRKNFGLFINSFKAVFETWSLDEVKHYQPLFNKAIKKGLKGIDFESSTDEIKNALDAFAEEPAETTFEKELEKLLKKYGKTVEQAIEVLEAMQE